jgi:uncharacterized membrane protein (DUF4010 family)
MDELVVYRDFAVALAAGLLIGVERGWRLRGEEPGTRVAGVRTFALVGGFGGASAIIGQRVHPLASVALIAGAVAMLVVSHIRAIDSSVEVSATSFIAVVLALAFGLLAGAGAPALAMAGAAVTTLVLSLRSELHSLVSRLGETDIKALARFAIIAVAILPFLPNQSFGPYDAWNPFQLWIVVVLVTGFSFSAYIANRLFGAKRGTLLTAVIAGAYSSTAVTAVLSHRLREEPGAGVTLCAGIVLASSVSLLRVLILTAVIASFALPGLTLLISPAAIVMIGAGLVLTLHAPSLNAPMTSSNPVDPLPALAFLALVAGMSLGARWAQTQFGDAGIATLALIVGTFDIDAAIITLGGLPHGTVTADLAAGVLALSIVANMILKLGIVLLYGGWSKGKPAILALLACALIIAALVMGSFSFFWR